MKGSLVSQRQKSDHNAKRRLRGSFHPDQNSITTSRPFSDHDIDALENVSPKSPTAAARANSLHGEMLDHVDDDREAKTHTLNAFVGSRQFKKWEQFASLVLKRGYWSRLGDLAKTLQSLPEDVEAIYIRVEKVAHVQLDPEVRLQYYKEFTRTALGSSVLRFSEVEVMVKRMGLADHLHRIDLYNLMNSKLEANQRGGESNEFFDFELFASLVCDLHQSKLIHEEQVPETFPSEVLYAPSCSMSIQFLGTPHSACPHS
jgi:hypothetical protein